MIRYKFGHEGAHERIIVDGRRPKEIRYATLVRFLLHLDIQFVESFNMIGRERDRYDQHVLVASLA